MLAEARPAALDGETLTLEFPATADFHRRQAEESKNVTVIREALYEVTGHRLGVTLALGDEVEVEPDADEQLTEDALISMFKDTPFLIVISVPEMVTRARQYGGVNFTYVEALTLAGLIFLVASYPTAILMRKMEKRLAY